VTERKLRWLVRVGTWLLRVLASTWRIRYRDDAPVRQLRVDRTAFVYALWHGHLLPLVWTHRNLDVGVLISEHRDGEIIARVVERLGFRSIRGSTSRGAARALITLSRELSEGRSVAITPDGPRGPAREFAPGALVAAQRANAPIVPVAVFASRAWYLESWDRFVIPKPFARVVVAYGPPSYVRADSPREAAQQASAFQRLIDEAAERARGEAH
jgi:lysophospholipid acyltransferase (LPLAT)-like uncharacterized protein